MPETIYRALPRTCAGTPHAYGPRLHLASQPLAMSILARLGSPEAVQPEVNILVRSLYAWLTSVVANAFLDLEDARVPTRMAAAHPDDGVYQGQRLRRDQPVVVIDIARGGILPAATVFEALAWVLDPAKVRQDHVVASRTTDPSGRVTGVALNAAKIGGPIDGATVLVPDPMGATGTSVCGVLDHYRDHVPGVPARIVLMNLIVTPEYVQAVRSRYPEAEIVAVRLDRGLSDPAALERMAGSGPGERGLNDHQYIVPGAGGLGEVLNNAWV